MAARRDRRTGFSRRAQYGAFFSYVFAVAGVVVGAALLAMSSFDPPAFAALRMAAASVTAPVSSAVSAAVGDVAAVPEAASHYLFVAEENAALRDALERERALMMRARGVLVENRHLRTLLGVRDRQADTVAVARLVSSTASSARRFALLDAGRWQGVRPGMPVRVADGLVGRVIETGPLVARVLLLSDAESIVPVMRTRDGLPAAAAGRGDGLVDIRAVSGTAVRFRPGDLFVTSGVGGLYAPGIPVARVERAAIDSVPTPPLAAPDALDIALVQRAFLPLPAAAAAQP